jgi:hypothetical protein
VNIPCSGPPPVLYFSCIVAVPSAFGVVIEMKLPSAVGEVSLENQTLPVLITHPGKVFPNT